MSDSEAESNYSDKTKQIRNQISTVLDAEALKEI